jgi:hypothetical protein
MVAYWNWERGPKVFTRDTAIREKTYSNNDNDASVKVEIT